MIFKLGMPSVTINQGNKKIRALVMATTPVTDTHLMALLFMEDGNSVQTAITKLDFEIAKRNPIFLVEDKQLFGSDSAPVAPTNNPFAKVDFGKSS